MVSNNPSTFYRCIKVQINFVPKTTLYFSLSIQRIRTWSKSVTRHKNKHKKTTFTHLSGQGASKNGGHSSKRSDNTNSTRSCSYVSTEIK
jgi:hypothetical protein